MSDVKTLKPWTDLVALNSDIEDGEITQSKFAIDFGDVAAGDPNQPAVNRNARLFFEATYLTPAVRSLLAEMLDSLAGSDRHNRIIKLRTPFGGGKSHTLLCLLHAARDRAALDRLPEAVGMAKPGKVCVAVFDGEKQDAVTSTIVAPGRSVRTMWGWLAWQIGGEAAYAMVEKHDQELVAPGGDVIRRVLTEGAGDQPVLILCDEVLKYMERAGAVQVHDSTLQRQTLNFFHDLTVEVARTPKTFLVYSLQWSAKEALDNVSLLNMLDKVASRVDQLREPVPDDEILPVLQRRLLAKLPAAGVGGSVAAQYEAAITSMREAYAVTLADKQIAVEDGIRLRDRFEKAYPLHPALIDAMKERWTSIDDFQRTRGALRFIAQSLKSTKERRLGRPLLGPGDIPLADQDARETLLKELAAHQGYANVIAADIAGPNARAGRIDEQMARDRPELSSARPATRLATAIFVYSFGGLRRNDASESDALPPGISERELFESCLAPDLDRVTLTSALAELRNACLYLHFDGSRYCFKTDPNITKLIEDTADDIARSPQVVENRIKELLEVQLAGRAAILWPDQTSRVPNDDPRFVIAYMPLNRLLDGKSKHNEAAVREYLTKFGDRPRNYKNAIGIALPDTVAYEPLCKHVRYQLAAERIYASRVEHRLNREMLGQLQERQRSETASVTSALRQLYTSVWLPVRQDGPAGEATIGIDKNEIGGRTLAATTLHERLMELLTEVGAPKVHQTVTARKVAERARLDLGHSDDESSLKGVRLPDVINSFFAVLGAPRLTSVEAIKTAVVDGVAQGLYGYASITPVPKLGSDGTFQIARDRVAIGIRISSDEVDLETGFLISPSAIPATPLAPPPGPGLPPMPPGESPTPEPPGQPEPPSGGGGAGQTGSPTTVRLHFHASRDGVYRAFRGIANLTDKSSTNTVEITVKAEAPDAGFDSTWLRNAVYEPIEEAGITLEEE